MSRAKKILIAVFALVLLLPLTAFGYLYFKMNSMYVDEDSTEYEISVSDDEIPNNAVLDDNITNILIIGSDERSKNERGRSDAMMIATIDEKHKSLKLTSIARDTYVKIPGHGHEKLNHAYSYGGPKLLMQTIESNFGVGISSYVNINFTSFIDIIDALGGITLDIKSSEIKELNKYIPECYSASSNNHNKPVEYIKSPGVQKLNGYQALSYARIRKNDSAFQRDGRQRAVLQSLLNEVSTMSFGEVTKVANAVFPYIKTNIKPMEMIKYVGKVLKIGNFEIKQLEFPIAEYSKGGILKGKGWVLQFNPEKCLPILHDFIFEDSASDKFMNFLDDYTDNSAPPKEEIIESTEENEEDNMEIIEDNTDSTESENDNKPSGDITDGKDDTVNEGDTTERPENNKPDNNKPDNNKPVAPAPKPPVSQEKPTKPEKPVTPEKPSKPSVPEKPVTPEKPTNPDNSESEKPGSDNGANVGDNTESSKPTEKPDNSTSTDTEIENATI